MNGEVQLQPSILRGQDGEPPIYVNRAFAATPEEAIAFAIGQGEGLDESTPVEAVTPVLMRELDPLACQIRGVDEGWHVECTARAKKAVAFWRIDD